MAELDFVSDLTDPTGWLLGVVANFVAHGFDRTTCTIRRGTTGTGAFPNNKIEEPSYRQMTHFLGFRFEFTVTEGRTFNGRHHGEMMELDDLERHDGHWGSKFTLDEAKRLLSDRLQ